MGDSWPSNDDQEKMINEPLLVPNQVKGGFKTLPFILVSEAFENVASLGLMPNMVLYLKREYGMGTAKAANVIFLWFAASNIAPILGAFLADSYVGRYPMISFGCLIGTLGTTLLWSTTLVPKAIPLQCEQSSDITCKTATPLQLLQLYTSLCLMAIGSGCIKSSSLAFGADQLNATASRDCTEQSHALTSFFSWYYVTVTASMMLGLTSIVYVQDSLGWEVGFGISVVLMIISALSFFSASSFYVKVKVTKSSLVTRFAQVLVASFKKRSIRLPEQHNASCELYYHEKGSTLLVPTDKLRFLNKACIIRNSEEELTMEGNASDPWSLCAVDQVEELKSLIRVIPIWSTGMIMCVNTNQNSLQVIQLSTMKRHITPQFEIPAGSFTVFLLISLTLWIALYTRVLIPIVSNIKGKHVRLTQKQRMGVGLICSALAMAALAFTESIRREVAISAGFADNPSGVVSMSAFWLLPYYVLNGVAEGFVAIPQNEFYYNELPKTMSSIASSLFLLGMSGGSLVASCIMNAVNSLTSIRGEGESWISSNINKGHYDYYFWLLASLGVLNFVYYVACSASYGPFKDEAVQVSDDTEVVGDE